MESLHNIVRRGEAMNRDDLVSLLSLTEAEDLEILYRAAYETKVRHVGNIVYYRGLMEFSNQCMKNCLYCGIRRENGSVKRFRTDLKDIESMAQWAYENGYGSVTLQSGERQDEAFIHDVEVMIRTVKAIGDGALGITLCVGSKRRKPIVVGSRQVLIAIYCALRHQTVSFMRPCILMTGCTAGRSGTIV